MKKASYRAQDYAFGQRMLALRMGIGLTQSGLAALLGVSRHAVGEWETGQSYPKANHLKHVIALGLQHHTWIPGQEAEEIRALWHAAHQKVLLDERWLQEQLSQQASPLVLVSTEPARDPGMVSLAPAHRPQVDWGDALDIPTFYGRDEEIALLTRWLVQEHCRVVTVQGMGGVGKSALATRVMHQVAAHFEVVIWRSLRDAPACEILLEECLQVLVPQPPQSMPASLEGRLHLLMAQMRERRVLLVLDNLEVILEEGTGTGRMQASFQGYARLLQRVGETRHQSCLLLTSREKPTELGPLEGSRSPVRTLHLIGLDAGAGAQLLAEKDVAGNALDRTRLVEAFRGNPLALKIVAQTIVELFGGEITPFLEQGNVIFGGVRELLHEQYERLSAREQRVLLWLAILREPVRLEEVLAVLNTPLTLGQVLETLDRLGRRSLIERGQRAGSFTLQSVVLEYAKARLIDEASREIEQGQLDTLVAYGLCQAQAKQYVRQAQERQLVVPLLARLRSVYQGQAALEERLLWLLDDLRWRDQNIQGYGPANLVTLLRLLRGNLRGLDLSRLALRGVMLQGVQMQDTNLSRAVLQDSTFTESIDAITAIAISRDGQYWVAATWQGEVRVWREEGKILHLAWQAHSDTVRAIACSPDGRTLATGSFVGPIKIWNLEDGMLLWTGGQIGGVRSLAFAPDGHLLASGGEDNLISLWDARSGTKLQTLAGQCDTVRALAFSPDGRLLTSGSSNGNILLWELPTTEPHTPARTLVGHTHWVTGLAFSPDGTQLASASWDQTIKLWNITSGDCLQTFSKHTDRVQSVAWSPDGRTLASAGFDTTVWLWDATGGTARAALHGHTAVIYEIAFTPDSRHLLSSSTEGTIRIWDVDSGQCHGVIEGYVASLLDIDWSPDGTQLASGGADTLVTLWNVALASSQQVLRGHRWTVQGVGWSPDGHLLASAGYNSVRLWDTATGGCLQELRDPDAADIIFQGVGWSPDGQFLACGSYLHGVLVWDVNARSRRWVGQTQPTRMRHVAWKPDGSSLVSGGDDGYVYVWDTSSGTLQQRLAGYEGAALNVAWSPDGMWLASAGSDREMGKIVVWEANSGKHVRTLVSHRGTASAVAWSPSGRGLVSGGSDGILRWWEIQSGACAWEQEAHRGTVQALKVSPDGNRLASCGDDGALILWDLPRRMHLQTLRRDRPYERLNITGIRGLSEPQKASLRALGACEETSVDNGECASER